MPRSQDPRITEAALAAVRELLGERGFAGLSMEAVAERAGVGKPALYRRFTGKADLVAAALAGLLRPMADADPATAGDLRQFLRELLEQAVPEDPAAYAGLLGGLMAEQHRHPQLIAAFRERVLLPRRAVVRAAVQEGRRRGVLRADLDSELAIDLFAGPLVGRAFAGLPMDRDWRDALFAAWWDAVAAPRPD